MSDPNLCPRCRTPLSADTPAGICPQCEFQGALDVFDGAATQIEDAEVVAADVKGETISASSLHLSDAPPAFRQFGDYELLAEIARGGMGVVYKARQCSLNRVVALKMILSGQFASKQEVLRFRSEAEAAANLHHPNIVAIYETGECQGQHYFSMEYIPGRSLAELVRDGPLPAPRAAHYAQIIAQAIQYAHQQGILHRDLKPSNVLIDVNDQPRITDFGLAKRVRGDCGLTLTGQAVGSPSFMPPEQIGGGVERSPELKAESNDINAFTPSLNAQLNPLSTSRAKVGPPSDVYGIGAILYHVLTGRPPFQAETIDAVLAQLRSADPVRPRLLNPSVPPELETICLKCLEKEPAKRYTTAQALANELGRFMRHEPILARPASRWERTRKWAQRRPAIAALAAGIIVSLGTGLLGVAWQWRRAETNAQESRLRLEQLNLANGLRSEEEGDLLGALPWFVEAMDSAQNHPEHQRVHRIRFASALRQSPRLVQFGDLGKLIFRVEFSPRRNLLFTADAENHGRVWNLHLSRESGPVVTHSDLIDGAAFSADERLLVTTSYDATARVWNLSGRAAISPPLPLQNSQWGDHFRVSISHNGRFFVTRCDNNNAQLWELSTAQPIGPRLQHEANLVEAEFSPDDQWLLTASEDKTARVWRVETGEPRTPPMKHEDRIRHARFSHDGRRVVTASEDKTARVWDAASGQPVTGPLRHETPVNYAEFSPDDHLLVTASGMFRGISVGDARIWNANTGSLIGSLDKTRGVTKSIFAPDGRRILTVAARTLRVWTADGKAASPLVFVDHRISGAAFNADGNQVIAVSDQGKIYVWDFTDAFRGGLALEQSSGAASADLESRGDWILSGGPGNAARIWNARTGEPAVDLVGHSNQVNDAVFSPDGRYVATASQDATARVWEAQSGKSVSSPMQHQSAVVQVCFSPDGRKLLTASRDHTAALWDAGTGQALTPPLKHGDRVNAAVFSPDGRLALTASHDETARLWDVETGLPIGRPFNHGSYVLGASFSPDGQFVLTASSDQTAQIWSVNTGLRKAAPLRHFSLVKHAEFSPDGKWVVTASFDKSARVWSANTGQPLSAPLLHEDVVVSATFSPDSRLVATASYDKTARIWEVATGAPVTPPLPHQSNLRSVKFSPDGKGVWTASYDGPVRFWSLSTDERDISELTQLAQVLSGRRSQAGNLVAFEPPVPATSKPSTNLWQFVDSNWPPSWALRGPTLNKIWQKFRAKYPDDFATTPEQVIAWHRREAKESETDKDWFAAVFHLDRLLESQPGNSELLRHREEAQAELKKAH